MSLFDFLKGPKTPNIAKNVAQDQQNISKAGDEQINKNTRDVYNPFGSSTVARDPVTGLPSGVNNSLDPSLNAGAFGRNLGLLGGQLPGTTIDFSNTTPEEIASRNYGAYAAMRAPQRTQQQEALRVDLTNRGIPVGDTPDAQGNPTSIWGKAMRNQTDAFNIADMNAAAQAWNAVPGMQATMTDTAQKQGESPYRLSGLTLGLMQGMAPLTGQAQVGQGGYAPVSYSDQAWKAYDAEAKKNADMWAGIGGIGKTLLTPLNPFGGFGSTMAGGLFNGMANYWPGTAG